MSDGGFEYLIMAEEEVDFNQLGREDWELVTVVARAGHYETNTTYYFKRPIPDLPIEAFALGQEEFYAAAVPAGDNLSGTATQSAVAPSRKEIRKVSTRVRAENREILDRLAHTGGGMLTADQVARYLHISTQTLANWRATGRYADQLPFVKIGGSVRYRSEDVERVQQEGIVKK